MTQQRLTAGTLRETHNEKWNFQQPGMVDLVKTAGPWELLPIAWCALRTVVVVVDVLVLVQVLVVAVVHPLLIKQ